MSYKLGLYRDNGKENGNDYIIRGYILGLYGDNGKEHGNQFIVGEHIGATIGIHCSTPCKQGVSKVV